MSKHYDIFTIQQYLTGALSKEEMYQLEHDALRDPMLQDAIDGFESSKAINTKELSLLQQRIQKRIVQQHNERNHFYFGRQRLAIASVAGVLFIVVCLLFWMINFPLKKPNQQSSLKEVNINQQSVVNISLKSGNLEPEIGWADYNHYLRINNQENLSGERIEISFEVLNQRPISLKVVTSGNEKSAKEIIKLIENGPKWKGTSGVLVVQY